MNKMKISQEAFACIIRHLAQTVPWNLKPEDFLM